MCSVSAALSGLTGFGSSLSGQYGTYQQQKLNYQQHLAQNEILKRQADDEAKSRAANALLNYQTIQLQEQEANAAATQQKTEVAREIQKAKALNKLSALEAGVNGNSVDRLDTELGFVQGQKNAAIETTRVSAIDQLEAQKLATYYQAQVNPVYTYTGPKPTFGASNILSATLSGLSGYMGAGGTFNMSNYSKKLSESSGITVQNSRIQS